MQQEKLPLKEAGLRSTGQKKWDRGSSPFAPEGHQIRLKEAKALIIDINITHFPQIHFHTSTQEGGIAEEFCGDKKIKVPHCNVKEHDLRTIIGSYEAQM